MITNDDHDKGNENIALFGGIWDMDNRQQAPNPFPAMGQAGLTTPYDPARFIGVLMRFNRVRNLTLRGLTLRDPTTFGAQLGNLYQFTVRDIRCAKSRRSLDGNPPAGPVWHGFAPFYFWGKARVRNLTIDGYSRVEERQACDDIHIEPEVVVDGLTLRDFRTVNHTPGPIVLLNNRGTVRNLVLDDISQVAEGTPARGGLIRNSGTLSDVRMTGERGENLAELVEGITDSQHATREGKGQ